MLYVHKASDTVYVNLKLTSSSSGTKVSGPVRSYEILNVPRELTVTMHSSDGWGGAHEETTYSTASPSVLHHPQKKPEIEVCSGHLSAGGVETGRFVELLSEGVTSVESSRISEQACVKSKV